MLEANKNRPFETMFNAYVKWQLKKNMYGIRIYDPYREERKQGNGQLFLPNHSSWWDGLLIFYLSQNYFHIDPYAMMGEKGMREFPFFRKIGAYSINYQSPKDSILSLKYTIRLLDEKNKVWIFPQGEEQHVEKRPLAFKPGVAYVAENTSVPFDIVPIALYYTLRHDQLMECWIRVGRVVSSREITGESRAEKTANMEAIVTKELDLLRRDLIEEKEEQYAYVMRGKKTLSDWFQYWKKEKGGRG